MFGFCDIVQVTNMSTLGRKIGGVISFSAGIALLTIGLFGVGTYIWIAIDALNQSDKSWLFWGAIFLVFGIPASIGGFTLSAFGVKMYRGVVGMR